MENIRKNAEPAPEKSGGWFKGRATRSAWWGTLLITISTLVLVFLVLLDAVTDFIRSGYCVYCGNAPGFIFCALIVIFAAALNWAVSVRRLHDRNMSGWWLLLFRILYFIPIINFFSGIAEFVILGCLDGSVGANSYGRDPRGRLSAAERLAQLPSRQNRAEEDAQARLGKLTELHEKGLISDAEYNEKRTAILDSI